MSHWTQKRRMQDAMEAGTEPREAKVVGELTVAGGNLSELAVGFDVDVEGLAPTRVWFEDIDVRSLNAEKRGGAR